MPNTVGPFHIDATRLVFAPNQRATTVPVTPTFYQDLDRNFDSFAGHILVQRFEFDEPWPTWEMHPEGDEFVYLITGDTDLLLRSNGADEVIRISRPGDYVVVPAGTWHTARPHASSMLLFVTPGEGTLNADAPPD